MNVQNTMIPSSIGVTGKTAGRSGRSYGLLAFLVLTGMVVAFLAVTPVSADEKYMAGSPELSAAISGSNELSPGDEVKLAISVQNSGVNQYKFVGSNIVSRDDLPNTAKFLKATLSPGQSPIIVKSDPQILGDLAASSKATATFTVKVPSDAVAGTYQLPVTLQYTYLSDANQ